jgi:hypothetical protein
MENQQFTAEEMAAKKNELIDSYKEQSEFLEVQLKYETLTADIEEQRLRRLVASMRQAQIMAPAPQESQEQEEAATDAPPRVRTLKKDK